MKIRHKIFETNSSSSHSFIIYGNKTDYETPIIDGPIEIQCGEYGWEIGSLASWIEKAEYLATYAKTIGKESDVKLFEETMSEYLKTPVTIGSSSGYVDHQSHDNAALLFKNILETVFRRNLVIYLDNDNH